MSRPLSRPTLPPTVVHAARLNVDVHVGPRGLRLVAFRGGSAEFEAVSEWSMEVAAAWRSLGEALAPALVSIANRAAATAGHEGRPS